MAILNNRRVIIGEDVRVDPFLVLKRVAPRFFRAPVYPVAGHGA